MVTGFWGARSLFYLYYMFDCVKYKTSLHTCDFSSQCILKYITRMAGWRLLHIRKPGLQFYLNQVILKWQCMKYANNTDPGKQCPTTGYRPCYFPCVDQNHLIITNNHKFSQQPHTFSCLCTNFFHPQMPRGSISIPFLDRCWFLPKSVLRHHPTAVLRVFFTFYFLP